MAKCSTNDCDTNDEAIDGILVILMLKSQRLYLRVNNISNVLKNLYFKYTNKHTICT